MRTIDSAFRTVTSSGLVVIVTPSKEEAIRMIHGNEPSELSYHRNILEMQKQNCGYFIIDERFGEPVDNEYELEEVYGIIKETAQRMYLNKVAEIHETLAFAIQDYKEGKLSDEDMQRVIRKAWEDKPKDYMLVDADLAETLELGEEMAGKVVETAPYEDEQVLKNWEELVEDIIASVPGMKTDGMGRLSIYGSNSLIQNIIGQAEFYYFR